MRMLRSFTVFSGLSVVLKYSSSRSVRGTSLSTYARTHTHTCKRKMRCPKILHCSTSQYLIGIVAKHFKVKLETLCVDVGKHRIHRERLATLLLDALHKHLPLTLLVLGEPPFAQRKVLCVLLARDRLALTVGRMERVEPKQKFPNLAAQFVAFDAVSKNESL